MAAIDITDEEIEDWTPKVHEIVKWFGKLREIDLSNAEEYEAPGREGLMADDWMRDDEPEYFEDVERMMKESAHWDGKFIKVPAVGGSVGTDFGPGATSVDEPSTTTTASELTTLAACATVLAPSTNVGVPTSPKGTATATETSSTL